METQQGPAPSASVDWMRGDGLAPVGFDDMRFLSGSCQVIEHREVQGVLHANRVGAK